jgi:hypothetical protein
MYTVKKQFHLLALIGFMLSGCTKEVMTGSGPVIAQDRVAGTFTYVRVDGPFYVHLSESANSNVSVTAEENLMRVIETYVTDSTLHITLKKDVRLNFFRDIHITVKSPAFKGISFYGPGAIDNTDTLHTDHFTYHSEGSGNARFTVLTNTLETAVNGSGNISLYGNAATYNSNINGSGNVGALDLTCIDANISVNGSGGQTLNVIQSLDVSIRGSGSVRYTGNPVISSDIAGSGRVTQL